MLYCIFVVFDIVNITVKVKWRESGSKNQDIWSYRITRQKTQRVWWRAERIRQNTDQRIRAEGFWRSSLTSNFYSWEKSTQKLTDLLILQVSFRIKSKPGRVTLIPMPLTFTSSLFLEKLCKHSHSHNTYRRPWGWDAWSQAKAVSVWL